jgi:hypothetical protein
MLTVVKASKAQSKSVSRFYRDLNPDYKDQNLGC